MLTRYLITGAGALALAVALWFSVVPSPDPSAAVPATVIVPGAEGAPDGGVAGVDAAPPTGPAPEASAALPAPPAAPGTAAELATVAEPSSVGVVSATALPDADADAAIGAADGAAESGSADGNVDFALDERDADGADGAETRVVDVPDTYPVADAAKYFVPREERRPGNLGGPPPLDFPGGPGDPDAAGPAALPASVAPVDPD